MKIPVRQRGERHRRMMCIVLQLNIARLMELHFAQWCQRLLTEHCKKKA